MHCETSRDVHTLRLLWLLLAVPMLAAVGCNSSDFQMAAVTGIVTIDGKPYPGGRIIFTPVAKDDTPIAGRASFGVLDAEGRFVLSCYEEGDGAIVGDHSVTLFRAENDADSRPDLKEYKFSRVSLPDGPIAIGPSDNEVTISFTAEQLRRYGNRL